MGFFSELLGTVTSIGGALLGIPPVAPTPQALALAVQAPLAAAPVDVSGLTEAAQARVRAGTVGQVSLTREQALAREKARMGTGRLRKRTIVETFDPVTGVVTRSKTTPGGVAVFAQDVAAARRINRQVRKLEARLPRKTVKQSPIKALTDRVIKNALEHAGDPHLNGSICPK